MIDFFATQIFGKKLPDDLYTNFDAYAPRFVEFLSSEEIQHYARVYDAFAPIGGDQFSWMMSMIATDPDGLVDIIAAHAESRASDIEAFRNFTADQKTLWEDLTEFIWNPEVTAKLGELQTKAMEVGSIVADYVTASGDFGIGTAIVATTGIAGAFGATYFKARKIDLGMWWKGLTGQKQDQVSEDKRWRNVAGVARKAAVLIDHVAERTGIARGQAHELREEVTFFAPFAGAAYCPVTAENKAMIDERLDNALRLDIEIEQVGADINASVVCYVYRDGNDILTEGTSLLLSAPDDIKLLVEQYLRTKENRDFAERMLLKLEQIDQAQPSLETAPAC
ncbi:MAG: hypothetical protein ACFE0S_00400 [Rhodospirillales bacterium]